jgi:hypothetical protein
MSTPGSTCAPICRRPHQLPEPAGGPPASPFLIVPQLPTVDHGMGSPLEPTPGVGLQAPLVLGAPPPSSDLGRAAYLSARTIDSYLLTNLYSAAPPDLTSFWIHGVFLPDSPHSSHMLLSACSIARRWLLEKFHALTDLPARVRNIIGRELAHRTRWTASATRTQNHAMPLQHDRTPSLPNSRVATRRYALTFPPPARR